MRILVTGARGMLGTDLCAELGKRHDVAGFDMAEADLTAPASVDALAAQRPQAVVHCAAMTDVDACERDPDAAYAVNGLGTRHVALACQRLDVPLLYVSTDFVFDGAKREPYYEWDAANPLGHYGRSKLAGEQAVRELLDKFFIVRISWLFGKHGRNFVASILAKARSEGTVRVVDDQTGSPSYAPDISAAMARLIESPYYGTYHLTNGGSCTWHGLAAEAVRFAGIKAEVAPIASADYPTPTRRPAYSVLKNFCWERTFGAPLRPWQDALREHLA
ncbi:MAG: dTDP-4-dehydrorhamnose reductase [Candidatus Edwardsbacteria bacterium]|jgi:dTDP-4-dehydrorhamnose reductase|nr:dTDP-4-dehydrorhamnose reductase [Candidatus Edwardsbacteria bacterium]